MNNSSQALVRIAVALHPFSFAAPDILAGIVRFNRKDLRYSFRDLIFEELEDIVVKLKRLNPEGLILSVGVQEYQQIQTKLREGLPIVNIGPELLSPGVPVICTNSSLMMESALQHLRDAGYESFAYVGRKGSPGSQRRGELLSKLVPGLDVHKIKWPEGIGSSNDPASSKPLERWIAGLPRRTGIITFYGHYARCVCLACEKLELTVPGDVGVLSLLDEKWCISSAPTISAVRFDGEQIGYETMSQLAALMRGRKPKHQLIQIAPRDVIGRDSTIQTKHLNSYVPLAVNYIEEHACRGITVKEVLKATQPSSRAKFYNDFSEKVGLSPAEYIRKIKIEKAKTLLAENALPIARIAGLCGFRNAAQFSETFDLEMKTTPRDYRKKYGKTKQ